MPPRPNSPSISYLPALVAVTIFLFPRCRHKTAYFAPSRRSVPGSIPLSAHCFALATGRVAAERAFGVKSYAGGEIRGRSGRAGPAKLMHLAHTTHIYMHIR